MQFHELKAKANKTPKRAGRGISAGRGKTAGRGTKGQGARKSGGVRPGFEGGQVPLYLKIPKLRGFKSHHTKPTTVYTGDLEKLGKAKVDTNVLTDAGLIAHPHLEVKLINKGEVKKKMEVKLQYASKSSIDALQSAGGSFEKVAQVKRPKVKK